jgi:O-antigen ligase
MLMVAGIGTVVLGLTQSRGGGLGVLSGFAAIVWFVWPHWGRRLVVAGVLMAALAMVTPVAAPVRALFGIDALLRSEPVQVTTANFAAQERLAHWGAALGMWLHEPIVGIGAGNFPERYREYTPNWRFRISRGHAHSAYLQAAAQAGTVGLVCFVGLLCAFFRQSWRAAKRSRDQLGRGAAIGSLSVTAAIAVHGLFDYVHVLSLSLLLSVIWGMVHDESARAAGETLSHDGN